MEVKVVVIEPFTLLHQQTERNVERLFARSPDPEVSIAGVTHLHEALLEDPSLEHQLVGPASRHRLVAPSIGFRDPSQVGVLLFHAAPISTKTGSAQRF